jgi:hypothetical protein
LAYLREHTDDIDLVSIPVQQGAAFGGPGGHKIQMAGVGAVLKTCSGRRLAISRDDAEVLINDGVLQRLKIRCKLDTLTE